MNLDLLLVRAGDRLCALAVEHVEEIMRPLPYEQIPAVPDFVRGVSILRGKPTPIVDLRALLGDQEPPRPARLVALRTSGLRRVGLLVDDVLGIRNDDTLSREDLPPLLQDAATEIVQDLARLDAKLLTVLRAGSLLPEEVWLQIAHEEAPA